MSDMYNELNELDTAIIRFDGACAMVGLLRSKYYDDVFPEKRKLEQGHVVTDKILTALQDLLDEQQKVFTSVAENLYEIYFANKPTLELVSDRKGGVSA